MRLFTFPNRNAAIVIALCLFSISSAFAQYIKLRDFGSLPEGIYPYSSPVNDGTFLYGTTSTGAANGSGAIYKFNPADQKLTILHNFDETGGDGAYASMLYDGGVLYGNALTGGANGHGYIYKINTDGSGFTDLFDFNYGVTGGYPYGSLIANGLVFYGTTQQGGSGGYGTVFKISKDGSAFQKLYEFNGTNGGEPEGPLVYDGTYLYGTTSVGGTSFGGTVFKIKPDGSAFTTLLNFSGSNGSTSHNGLYFDGAFLWGVTQNGGTDNKGTLYRILPDGTGYTRFSNFNDGVTGDNPRSALISDGTYLYGTTTLNGAKFGGSVFKIKKDGSEFGMVVSLDNGPFGSRPEGTLTLIGSTLFGARSIAGHASRGEIFQVDTDGSGFQVRHSFSQEGNNPAGELISDGTYMYGVNQRGGEYDAGTVYRVKPDGTDFQTLVNFDGPTMGSMPRGRVFYNGSKLFGMTSFGGSTNKGTLYYVNTDGSDFTKLVDFDGPTRGEAPWSALISDGTYLYGMTQIGGTNELGVIFRMMPNGTNFSKLHDFSGNPDGAYSYGNLFLEGGILYGMTYEGGSSGYGTIFKMNIDGSGYQVLHSFDNDNGGYPKGSLYSDGTYLYGLTSAGGGSDAGTAFKIKKDGNGFEKMFDLDLNTGALPDGSFISDGTYLYAIMNNGGVIGNGTLLKVAFNGTFSRMMDFADGTSPMGTLYSDGTFLYGITQTGGSNNLGILYKRSLAPAVTLVNFTPALGAAGTYVGILGNDFDTNPSSNIVKFNGVTATVLKAKPDSLLVLVPEGASPGPISVTANGTTDTSIGDFEVTSEARMDNVRVRTCDVTFTGVGGDDDLVMTFEPETAGAKLTVNFTDMDIDDYLIIFDGPDLSTPIDTLGSDSNSFTYTSTAPGGELTFYYWWQDGGSDWEASIGCSNLVSLVIDTQPADAEVCKGTTATFTTSASGPNKITYQWQTSPDGNTWTNLSEGGDFEGIDAKSLTINSSNPKNEAWYRCHIRGDNGTEGNTANVFLTISTCGVPELIVYNAVSPNNDGKNEFLLIENVDVIPSKKENMVKIFNRWGDEVFAIANYNNKERVFNGINKNGNKLPSGTYFYKISFVSDPEITGYLDLKY